MTVESAKNKAGPFNVTGTSGTFPRDFLLLDEDHLRVIRVRDGAETDLTSGIGHTGIGTADGTVVISTGIQAGDQIYLLRAVPNLQRSDYNAQGRVRTEQVESDFDLAIMQVQDLREAQDRALTLPVSSEIGGEEAMAAALAAPEYAAQAREAAEDAQAAAASVPPTFASRMSAAAIVQQFPDGREISIEGIRYIVDSAATGMNSAMWDMGVDGVRCPDLPDNSFLFLSFDQDISGGKVRLLVGQTTKEMHHLNTLPLEFGNGVAMGGLSPSITFKDGVWYFINAAYVVGTRDFAVFRSRDLITWDRTFCNFGPDPITDANTPLPGGSSPPDFFWGAEGFFDTDGTLYVFASVRYGADFTDAFGNTVKHFRTYMSRCNDLNALTFDEPVAIDPDGDTQSLIDPHIVRGEDGRYCLSLKDEDTKRIRIYFGASINGPWTFSNEVSDPNFKIEGQSIVPRRYLSGGSVSIAYDMLVDAHNDIDGVRSVLPLRYTATDLAGPWSAGEMVLSSMPVRHGTLVNLSMMDPAAHASVRAAMAAYGGAPVAFNKTAVQLTTGPNTIYPQEGGVYYVTGIGNAADVTIKEGPADSFWLGCFSIAQGTGINVLNAFAVTSPFSLGFGSGSDRMVLMKRRQYADGYYPVGYDGRARFQATKGGTPQTIPDNTVTKVTFGTETRDHGGFYNSGTSEWTPPAGWYELSAALLCTGLSDSGNSIILRKNGVLLAQTSHVSRSGSNSTLAVTVDAYANGSDVFDVAVQLGSGGTVTGAGSNTWFKGKPA